MKSIDLKEQIFRINKLVEENYLPKGNAYPIYDGIINVDGYLSSKFKILWILKEPYDSFDENGMPYGGDWDMVQAINDKPNNFLRIPTWQQIIYVSYGIENNFMRLENKNMDDISDENSNVVSAFKNIAMINIQKLPAKTHSLDYEISEAYKKYSEILWEQINVFNPDIIIGGNTIQHFKSDSRIEKLTKINTPVTHYFDSNRIWVDAYHPSRFYGSTKKEYVNSIIEAIENWNKKFKRN